uniref:Putative secreted protein n=1 Tax=Anopheles darlingi TaxID=43151 RepID=A0A2M4DBV2_ANODA
MISVHPASDPSGALSSSVAVVVVVVFFACDVRACVRCPCVGVVEAATSLNPIRECRNNDLEQYSCVSLLQLLL